MRRLERGLPRPFDMRSPALIAKQMAAKGEQPPAPPVRVVATPRPELRRAAFVGPFNVPTTIEEARRSGIRGDRISAFALLRAFAMKHGVAEDALTGRSRARFVVALRHEAIAIVALARPDMSLPRIGKVFGGRDHTTILHAMQKMGVWQPGMCAKGSQTGRRAA